VLGDGDKEIDGVREMLMDLLRLIDFVMLIVLVGVREMLMDLETLMELVDDREMLFDFDSLIELVGVRLADCASPDNRAANTKITDTKTCMRARSWRKASSARRHWRKVDCDQITRCACLPKKDPRDARDLR
jgi:hypothetical protein